MKININNKQILEGGICLPPLITDTQKTLDKPQEIKFKKQAFYNTIHTVL